MNKHIFRSELEAKKDVSNGDFVARLTPGIDRAEILGIRVPELRRLAKTIRKEGNAERFLNDLPHRYLEEDLIHVFLISEISDYDACMSRLETFLPYVRCWMITDAIRPKVLRKHLQEAEPVLKQWLDSSEPYTVRTAIGLYMAYYLEDDSFSVSQAERIADLRFDHYYVRMMAAWYMATGLAKQPEQILPLLEQNRMDVWTHNKTIQKAMESYRVPDGLKDRLRSMKRRAK